MAIDEGFNVLVLHDVDLVPTPAMAPWYTFNVEGGPVHLGAAWGKYTYPEYLGGVLAVHASHFMAANGYPNSFWGWGARTTHCGADWGTWACVHTSKGTDTLVHALQGGNVPQSTTAPDNMPI